MISHIKKLKIYFVIAMKKGVFNICRVVFFRLQCKLNYFVLRLPIKEKLTVNQGVFYKENEVSHDHSAMTDQSCVDMSDSMLCGKMVFFFEHQFDLGSPPNWQLNPFNSIDWQLSAITHWSKLKHFSAVGNDIKTVWELSRFYWAPQLACAYALTRNSKYLTCLNDWLLDWLQKNPINSGYQWQCAQEVGIRLINFILVNLILKPQVISPLTKIFISEHCERILPTMHYALAQQNNHATSEASALFIAGVYMQSIAAKNTHYYKKALLWEKTGRNKLEKCIRQFVMSDGTFSQYSVTYHRLVLDSLSLCVYFQRKYKVNNFSDNLINKYKKMFEWLYQLVDPVSGDAPNLGSNDGTILFRLNNMSYRNFKPCLQFASALIFNTLCYEVGSDDQWLYWFSLNNKTVNQFKFSEKIFSNGGLVKFVLKKSWAVLRYPNFKFKPSQEDLFHFDLWLNGKNYLRDSGTYSYNAENKVMQSFQSASAHNVVQIGSCGQMNKVSRFMYGYWPKLVKVHDDASSGKWCGTYIDYDGNEITRSVTIFNDQYHIEDIIENPIEPVNLYWHLVDNIDWQFKKNFCFCDEVSLELFANDMPADGLQLLDKDYSLNYLKRKTSKVLVISNVHPMAGKVKFLTVISTKG